MKLIIAGSRFLFIQYKHIEEALNDLGWVPTEIVTGMCPNSADMVAYDWARVLGIPVKPFPTNWKHKGSGIERNGHMAEYADNLLAFWNGKSSGTKDMIERMRIMKKPYRVISPNSADMFSFFENNS